MLRFRVLSALLPSPQGTVPDAPELAKNVDLVQLPRPVSLPLHPEKALVGLVPEQTKMLRCAGRRGTGEGENAHGWPRDLGQ